MPTPQGTRLLEALGVAGGEANLEVLAQAAEVPYPKPLRCCRRWKGVC